MIYLTNPSELFNLKKFINFCFDSIANFNRCSKKIFIIWGLIGFLFVVVFTGKACPGIIKGNAFLFGKHVTEINHGFFSFIYMSLQDYNWNMSVGFFGNAVELKDQFSESGFKFLMSFVFSNSIKNHSSHDNDKNPSCKFPKPCRKKCDEFNKFGHLPFFLVWLLSYSVIFYIEKQVVQLN